MFLLILKKKINLILLINKIKYNYNKHILFIYIKLYKLY